MSGQIFSMKTLYVVGNGFDIAHGLKTSYWDFRCFLEEVYPGFLQKFEHLYNIEHLDLFDPRVSLETRRQWEEVIKGELWNAFEDKIGQPNISEMMDVSTSVLSDMNLDGGLIGIEDTMNSYWSGQYEYVKQLEHCVKEWIISINTEGIVPKRKTLIGSTDYFLNFNYTDLLENTYKIKDVLHIHGGMDSISGLGPIMGHCNYKDIEDHLRYANEADERLDEGKASIHRAIVTYLKTIYKDTNWLLELHHTFWEKLCDVDKVVIIGWSAGRTDLPYLKRILQMIHGNTKWFVYYYDDEAYVALGKEMRDEGIEKKYEVNYIPASKFWN